MKSKTPIFGPLLFSACVALITPPAECRDESGAFDPSLEMRFDKPVPVGTYAFDVERVFGTQTQMIRREATKYQRKIAEAHARAYMTAQLGPQATASASKSGKTDRAPEKEKSATAPQRRLAAKAKLPHYVAVETVKDERSVPGTKKDVMIWDTRSESLVDNNVYDVSKPPPLGSTEKFDTYSAQYVGVGSLLPEIAEPPKDAGRSPGK